MESAALLSPNVATAASLRRGRLLFSCLFQVSLLFTHPVLPVRPAGRQSLAPVSCNQLSVMLDDILSIILLSAGLYGGHCVSRRSRDRDLFDHESSVFLSER